MHIGVPIVLLFLYWTVKPSDANLKEIINKKKTTTTTQNKIKQNKARRPNRKTLAHLVPVLRHTFRTEEASNDN